MAEYREARALDFQNRGAAGGPGSAQPFELERFITANNPFAGVRNPMNLSAAERKAAQMRVCGFTALVLFNVLVVAGIGSLEPLQYGLTVNWITRQVNQEGTYQGGRHWIGPWNSFVPFPSTVVNLEFSTFSARAGGNGPLATRTKDGLSVTLHLAFQYRMELESLAKLYLLANVNYEPIIMQNARDVLLKAAADYEAVQYWQEREQIGVEMRDMLNQRLRSSVFVQCTGLQLLQIDMPTNFEDSIVQTQVQQQAIKTQTNEQQALRIQADTKVLQASYTRNVTVTQNGADAFYNQETKIAEARANQRLLDIEAETLQTVKEELGLTKSQILEYQQFVAYAGLQNASFLYGLGDNAMIQVATT